MLLNAFTFLYELLCGKNADISEYGDAIYPNAGLLTFVIVFIIAALFYLALGRVSNIWHARIHWVVTMVLAAVIGFAIAYFFAKSELGLVDVFLIKFALFNMLCAAVYFFLFSLLLKKFSIHARRTPF